ncbi:MAG: Uma2 family endonuclease [Planctomycetota bacterium]|nr:Uma2 family endonuclease [Planctomycetota bacterium]
MNTAVKFTYEEYRTLPENGRHYQVVDGDLIMSPSPTFRHQLIIMELSRRLAGFVADNRRGVVLFAPLDVILSEENVFQPDILYISNERRSVILREGLRGAPDLCVEVLSPSNRELDLTVKRLTYAKFGLPELWIVDPDADTLQLFRLQENHQAPLKVFGANDTLATPLLPGFSLPLREVFAR